MKLILEWLADGAIPVMATDPGMTCHYIHQESYDKPLEWSVARAGKRFPVQLFEERIDRFLKFLSKGLPSDGVLYLPIRSSYELDGLPGRHLIIGAAIFPFELPEPTPGYAAPYSHVIEGDLALIQRFCLLNTEKEAPQEEVLRKPWDMIQGWHHEWLERSKKRSEAEARAFQLLLAHLDEAQRKDLSESKSFKLHGKDGKRYLVTYRTHENVWLLDEEEKPVVRYCIVSEEDIPIYDQMLSQKLLLEHDPNYFFLVANSTTVPQEG